MKVTEGKITGLGHLAYNVTANHRIEPTFMLQKSGWSYLFLLFFFPPSGRPSGYEEKIPAQGEEYWIVVCRSTSGEGNFVSLFYTPHFLCFSFLFFLP